MERISYEKNIATISRKQKMILVILGNFKYNFKKFLLSILKNKLENIFKILNNWGKFMRSMMVTFLQIGKIRRKM